MKVQNFQAMKKVKLKVNELNNDEIEDTSKKFNLLKTSSKMLLNRNIKSFEDIEQFLDPDFKYFESADNYKDLHKGCERIIEAIISVALEDNVSFHIKKVEQIMEDFDYPGIRFILEAGLDNLRQVIKIDISTNDVITPSAIVYQYRLMFENRNIPLKAYNLETLLGEKIETVISRGTANTRMRDFYDIHTISTHKTERIDYK